MKYLTPHFESVLATPARAGNLVTILQNGDEIFDAMLEAIRDASFSIELVTYVYWHSKIAAQFANALCERARDGVKVRLLIDAFGGAIMSTRMVGQLEAAGVEIAWFRPFSVSYWRRFNHRNHRKILLVDGRVGFTGGVGIADQWTGNASDTRHWRDTHCRITGPACIDLAAAFAENWLEATGDRLAEPSAPESQGSTSIITTASLADVTPTAIATLFETAIAASTDRLWITTAYFVPSPELVAALSAAAARGVDVRILTNGSRSNHKLTLHAGRATYQALILAGVKIYEFQPTVLHVKTMTVDRQWVSIGSANLDNRSLVLNEELNISFDDTDIAAALDLQFLHDLKLARHVRTVYWQRRSWFQRLAELSSRAFSKQL
ncbi:MAG: phospholipase D-like domain-containing protein [Candidatus Saccharimonadales bacterium]